MRPVSLALVFLALSVRAAEPMCGTSADNDLRVRALHAASRARIRTNAELPRAEVRDAAFYLRDDETFTPGARPFDLDGQTLVFTPAPNATYTMQREALQYREPAGAPLRDFKSDPGALTYDLGFAFPAFGRNLTRVYVTANNSIEFDPPPATQSGLQFDALEAATHRQAMVSPLMLTAKKPRYVEAPQLFVEQTASALFVTWRSSGNAPFGYDVQASLRSDGTVSFSYRTLTAMRWGAPVITPGFAPANAAHAVVSARDDSAGDISPQVRQPLRDMIDLRKVEVSRVGTSDLFSVRMTVAAPIQQQSIATGEVLGYQVTFGDSFAAVEVDGTNVTVRSFTGISGEVSSSAASVDGNVVEIFGVMPDAESVAIRAASYYRPINLINDSVNLSVDFPAPARATAVDLSALPQGAALALPIVEPFVLGSFDPFAVWAAVQQQYGLRDDAYDGVLMYQTYFTDMIFFAGAYATGGNAGVDGIAPSTPTRGTHAPRAPTLMHMNQVGYNYSVAEPTASKLMLHEFGHRWLYFFSIMENGVAGRYLNPVSAHPAAYVHTASAFPVYGADESSVMGGAFFTQQNDGSYRAHAANYGYSWMDLYCMGLASKAEVTPWFYIAGTTLAKEYWPAEGAIAIGERHDVTVDQMTSVHGPRYPSLDYAQRQFRVLFILVTDADRDATDAEVGKVNQWRSLMARNFFVATGGRASLATTFVRPRYRSLRP